MMEKICCIISAGDVNSALLIKNKTQYDYFIAADSGYDAALLAGIKPQLLVGDFDSISQHSLFTLNLSNSHSPAKDTHSPVSSQIRESFSSVSQKNDHKPRIVKFPAEKDFSDTQLALEEGIRLGYTRFHIYGALGGERFSHSLSNLQTLCLMKSKGIKITLMGIREQVFVLSREKISIAVPNQTTFSVFSMSEETTGVSILGAKYPLNDYTLSYMEPLGLSNQSTEETVTISVKNGMLLVIWEL